MNKSWWVRCLKQEEEGSLTLREETDGDIGVELWQLPNYGRRAKTQMPHAHVQESFPWEQIAVTQTGIYDTSKWVRDNETKGAKQNGNYSSSQYDVESKGASLELMQFGWAQFSLREHTWNEDFVSFGFYPKRNAWGMLKLQQGKQSWDGWCCKQQAEAWLHLTKGLGQQQRKRKEQKSCRKPPGTREKIRRLTTNREADTVT